AQPAVVSPDLRHRRRPWPADQRLSSARAGLEPAPRRRSRRDVPGRRRPSGLCACDAERRPPGLVEPDLSHRLTRVAWPAPRSCQLCAAVEGQDGTWIARHMLPTRVRLSELFTPGMDTLAIYSFMYGPERERPCPGCTHFLDSLDGAM